MDFVEEFLMAAEQLQQHRQETENPYELTMMLYGSWYARLQGSKEVPENFPKDLVQVLRAADATGRKWESGWSADRVAPDGRVIARRGNEVGMADRCDYFAPNAVGVLPQLGDKLVLACRRDRVDGDGAWWRTGGKAWRFTRAMPGLVRLYWSVALAYLPELVHKLTLALADDERPWMLKCATDPAVHERADATVLYLAWDMLEELAPRIDHIAAALRPNMFNVAPPLTLPIHLGVSVAVDPETDESFGEHRCRLIAEALLSALADDADSLLVSIKERMAIEDIEFGRPYASRSNPLLPWE
jgi:hypothetical protein